MKTASSNEIISWGPYHSSDADLYESLAEKEQWPAVELIYCNIYAEDLFAMVLRPDMMSVLNVVSFATDCVESAIESLESIKPARDTLRNVVESLRCGRMTSEISDSAWDLWVQSEYLSASQQGGLAAWRLILAQRIADIPILNDECRSEICSICRGVRENCFKVAVCAHIENGLSATWNPARPRRGLNDVMDGEIQGQFFDLRKRL